tara:strand:- start:1242 stop:1565 length:324 start_codon:yes stop_codon:yes gene_type:complete
MSGKWTPGGGRNMYTKGLINEQRQDICYVFLLADGFNNNDNDQNTTLVSNNTPLSTSNTLAGIVIPQTNQKTERETLSELVSKNTWTGVNIEKLLGEYKVIYNLNNK